ncbi:hypothetical protein Btru_069509 [Bulinus truncatus]|nr:hypothetical protein Btru_069509 [Bulinus truncatus]
MVDSETHTMDKQLYGDYATQVSEGGEADLHKHLIDCKKNPGHKQFIPFDTFTLNYSPEGHRDNDLFEYIKTTADLTVRVNVKMTSPHRPEFWPNSKVSYPFYNMRGKTNFRTGSGMGGQMVVWMVVPGLNLSENLGIFSGPGDSLQVHPALYGYLTLSWGSKGGWALC